MFAIIGMFVVGLWLLKGAVNVIIGILTVHEQQKQLLTINTILAYKGPLCVCCGHETCLYKGAL